LLARIGQLVNLIVPYSFEKGRIYLNVILMSDDEGSLPGTKSFLHAPKGSNNSCKQAAELSDPINESIIQPSAVSNYAHGCIS